MVAYSFKKRFIAPIRVGLGIAPSVEEFAAGLDEYGNISRPAPKRQTIRAVGKRRHARPGDALQLYTAMRTKQCKKIGEALCTAVDSIKIEVFSAAFTIAINGKLVDRETMAIADGFRDAADMWSFWELQHGIGVFEGMLIRWEPLA